jgi:tRNA pseudouridine32 synthase/23S rRNA pseudouridine746 synthase/23S rRNA pseudouridine1911/1915/1917 synthase
MSPKKFKSSPKRYHPKGLTILYEDYEIIVIDKSSGLLTMGNEQASVNTAHYLLNEYVKKGNSKSKKRIYIVHRLDRDTSGVLVFAKSEQSKRFLQDNWGDFSKVYTAVITGTISNKEDTLSSYLVENSIHKVYSTGDPSEGKLAKTKYKVIKENNDFSLLEIELLTGRKNQIRVHLADKGCPIAGDYVYGQKTKGVRRLMLHAGSLSIIHPETKERMSFEAPLPKEFKALI